MTPPCTAGETNEPEKEPETLSVDTESAPGQDADAAAEDATDEVENDTAASEHTDDITDSDTDTESGGEPSDEAADEGAEGTDPAKPRRAISFPRPFALRRNSFSRLFAFGVLPCVVLLLALAAGYLKWQATSIRVSQTSGLESVAVAKDGTVAMLSYQPDTAEKDLGAARDRLTGTFKDSYTQLTHDVVIPGAKQRHISAVATVPAAASVSANASHAVVLVFVNQTVNVGTDPPSATASAVRVTLDKVGDRWLISGFDPI